MKLTEHSKLRLRQRAGVRSSEKNKLFRQALLKGISAGNTNNEIIKKYLLKKERHCKAKIYKDYVFMYSKNGKKLYTMYEVPNYIKEMIK